MTVQNPPPSGGGAFNSTRLACCAGRHTLCCFDRGGVASAVAMVVPCHSFGRDNRVEDIATATDLLVDAYRESDGRLRMTSRALRASEEGAHG
jgi:hypothetical protein